MKLIIAGTRSFNDYQLLENSIIPMFLHISHLEDIEEVVSGCCSGADQLGEKWGKALYKKITRFPADWKKYGKAAGPIRNRQMAEYADQAIVFWDGSSKGALNMIQTMRELGKPVYVVIYPKENKHEEAKKN